MSGVEVQVIPEDLTGKATQIRGLSWPNPAAEPKLVPPDALLTSSVATANLRANAEALWAQQEYGKLEGLRLAQTLDNVAAAYAEVDRISGDDIGSTMDIPASDGAVYPKGVDLPAPPRPPNMPIPRGQLPSEQLLFPPQAQHALEAGDGGTSLRLAADLWRSNAQALETSAQQFEVNSLLWEGDAADAAYAKFGAYRNWLISLAGSWKRLAGQADRMVVAHSAAKQDNDPVAADFETLQREIAQNPGNPENLNKTLRMAELQTQSEEIRNQYARDGQPYQIQPEDPPTPVVSGIPVTVDEHRRARKPLPDSRSNTEPGTGAARNTGGGSGESRVPADQSAVSSAERASQAGQQGGSPGGSQPGGGSPGGGAPGGGQPGGGMPGGGMPGGGMPVGPRSDPKLPTDPNLRPAAMGGGSGGGGGGGIPGVPLQPAVGAETVAPGPVVAPIAPAAAGGGMSGGAVAGGAMGGMAPMMHGAQGGGTGDKKRNPQLSQDEELYTEERPWTEAVIGNRVRRRGATEDTKKESQ